MKLSKPALLLCLMIALVGCQTTTSSSSSSSDKQNSSNSSASSSSISSPSGENSMEIYSAEDFKKINENLGGTYLLKNNIDFKGVTISTIGSKDAPFTGLFDGGNYTISNYSLPIDSPSLFDYVTGTVKNLRIDYTVFYSFSKCLNIGGIIGTLDGGNIYHCFSSGSLTVENSIELDTTSIGGIVGKNEAGTIELSASIMSITLSTKGTSFVGGIVGYNGGGVSQQALVKNCLARNSIITAECSYQRASAYVGGIAGYNFGTIAKSMTHSQSLLGKTTDYYSFVGGIVGDNNGGFVQDCFSASDCHVASNSSSTFRGSVMGRNFKATLDKNSGCQINNFGATIQSIDYSVNNKYEQTTTHEQVVVPLSSLVNIKSAQWYKNTLGVSEEFLIKNDYFPSLDSSFTKVTYTEVVGTPENPIEIESANQLANIDPTKSYILTKDISLVGIQHIAIGTSKNPYRGVFDGNGYKITGLSFSTPRHTNALFGYVNGSIKNLVVECEASINSTNTNIQYNAALAAFVSKSIIENCSSQMKANIISKGLIAGGLIGYAYNSLISQSFSTCLITGQSSTASNYIGGLIGLTLDSTVRECYSNSTLNGSDSTNTVIGGLVGKSEGEIVDCYAVSQITIPRINANTAVGGLIGYSKSGSITNVYTKTEIVFEYNINGQIGGIIGLNESSLSNCYYLASDNVLYSCGHSPIEVSVTRLSLEELMTAADKLGPNFVNVQDKLPQLTFQGETK